MWLERDKSGAVTVDGGSTHLSIVGQRLDPITEAVSAPLLRVLERVKKRRGREEHARVHGVPGPQLLANTADPSLINKDFHRVVQIEEPRRVAISAQADVLRTQWTTEHPLDEGGGDEMIRHHQEKPHALDTVQEATYDEENLRAAHGVAADLQRDLGLIRFRRHILKGGDDVHDGSSDEEPAPAPAV